MKKITMKNSCPKKWENMQGDDEVRLCESCDRNVEDFTNKSIEEIIEILESRKERTCARVFSSQLNPVKKIAAAVLIGGMLMGGSCAPKIIGSVNGNGGVSTIKMENEAIIEVKNGRVEISGVILAGEDGEAIGASVIIVPKEHSNKGEEIGILTEFDGTFYLEANLENKDLSDYLLRVIYTGYRSFSISLEKVNMKKGIVITLEGDIWLGELLLEEKRNFG